MFTALSQAFGQLTDPRIRTVLIQATGGALLVMLLIGGVASWGLTHMPPTGYAILDWVLTGAGLLSVLIIIWLLFPATVMIVASMFLEKVALAVEARHYPGLPMARDIPLSEDVKGAVLLALKALGLNLLFLPAYIFIGPLAPLLYVTLNGYIIGRDYFQQVALRRLPLAEIDGAFLKNRRRYWLGGAVIAGLGSVPFINLLTPVLATAFFIHLLQRGR